MEFSRYKMIYNKNLNGAKNKDDLKILGMEFVKKIKIKGNY